ncbi:hypothetical protein CCR75_004212 [Bremia lactucae]|uniref:Uncharacterized protein n=1 Tax=Bremia lactucae TaxID=4779 RepID=A0A976FIT3_BRELC|nr:hypothetical protein CCR75_004212 [Bremia lactucae]
MTDDVASDPEFKNFDEKQYFLIRQETLFKTAQVRMREAQERVKFYYDKNTKSELRSQRLSAFGRQEPGHLSQRICTVEETGFTIHWAVIVSKDSREQEISKRLKLKVASSVPMSSPKSYREDPKRTQQVDKVVIADGAEGLLVKPVILIASRRKSHSTDTVARRIER